MARGKARLRRILGAWRHPRMMRLVFSYVNIEDTITDGVDRRVAPPWSRLAPPHEAARGPPPRGKGATLVVVGRPHRILWPIAVVLNLAALLAVIFVPQLLQGPWGWAGLVVYVTGDLLAGFLIHKASPPAPPLSRDD